MPCELCVSISILFLPLLHEKGESGWVTHFSLSHLSVPSINLNYSPLLLIQFYPPISFYYISSNSITTLFSNLLPPLEWNKIKDWKNIVIVQFWFPHFQLCKLDLLFFFPCTNRVFPSVYKHFLLTGQIMLTTKSHVTSYVSKFLFQRFFAVGFWIPNYNHVVKGEDN